MAAKGSDCMTGKQQYATRRAAAAVAAAIRQRADGRSANAFRCGWCGCWHVGNKGGDTSKGRTRRNMHR